MTRTTRRGIAAVIAATALSAGLLAAPTAASAKGSSRCTVTASQRTVALDQYTAGRLALRGHKPTAAEKKALKAAIAELVRAARDAKMSSTVRAAKLAELRALRSKLAKAATAEERVAIRAEIRAIVLDLKAARLTGAERAEIAKKIKEMKAALRGRPTASEKVVIQASVKSAKKLLSCRVVAA